MVSYTGSEEVSLPSLSSLTGSASGESLSLAVIQTGRHGHRPDLRQLRPLTKSTESYLAICTAPSDVHVINSTIDRTTPKRKHNLRLGHFHCGQRGIGDGRSSVNRTGRLPLCNDDMMISHMWRKESPSADFSRTTRKNFSSNDSMFLKSMKAPSLWHASIPVISCSW